MTGGRTLFNSDHKIKAIAKLSDLQHKMNSEQQRRPSILHALKVVTFSEMTNEDSMRKN